MLSHITAQARRLGTRVVMFAADGPHALVPAHLCFASYVLLEQLEGHNLPRMVGLTNACISHKVTSHFASYPS
jgi:hypothetical protein